MLDGLERADGLTELVAHLRVLDRSREHRVDRPEHLVGERPPARPPHGSAGHIAVHRDVGACDDAVGVHQPERRIDALHRSAFERYCGNGHRVAPEHHGQGHSAAVPEHERVDDELVVTNGRGGVTAAGMRERAGRVSGALQLQRVERDVVERGAREQELPVHR